MQLNSGDIAQTTACHSSAGSGRSNLLPVLHAALTFAFLQLLLATLLLFTGRCTGDLCAKGLSPPRGHAGAAAAAALLGWPTKGPALALGSS
jgi:hypothetical protein